MLTAKGVPFDVAFSINPKLRLGWCIIVGELEGGVFDWRTLQWEKPT